MEHYAKLVSKHAPKCTNSRGIIKNLHLYCRHSNHTVLQVKQICMYNIIIMIVVVTKINKTHSPVLFFHHVELSN